MAALPTAQLDEVHALIMSKYSGLRTEVPITKGQLRSLLVTMDAELDSAETSVFAALPAGPGKTWIQANQTIARDFMTDIERKRVETF